LNSFNILLVVKEEILNGILKFILEAYFKCRVTDVVDEKEAVAILKEPDHDYHYVIYEFDPFSYFLDDLKKIIHEFAKFKTIILVQGEHSQNLEQFEKNSGMKLIRKEEIPLGVIREIQNNFTTDIFNSNPYCRIAIKQLIRFDGIKKNLYLKIGKEKMVHIFKEDDKTELQDILKYHQRGVEYMYLKRSTAEAITNQVQRQIKVYLKANNFKFVLQNKSDTPESLYEQRIIRINEEIYIDDQLRNIIMETVNTIKNKAMSEKRIDLFMSHMMSMPNHFAFFARKLELTSLFATLIVEKLKWNSKGTSEKIVYAAVLADITLAVRPKLLQIRDIDEFNACKEDLSEEDQEFFLSHPQECASLAEKFFQTAPAEIGVIIQQQHELPDGKGFPGGIKAATISPLSAAFIIASDLAHYILTTEGPSIDDYLTENKRRWDYLNFRQAYKALEEMRKDRLSLQSK
jgi:HD-GYP domain-containing protein (c-di-GMP phosphodiesterase class II)